jgi:membrane-associated phospholipid phosphatase
MPVTVRPTKADIGIARAIARRTSRTPEEVSQGVTWGADEHVLIGLAVGWWIWTRICSSQQQRAADHVLLTLAAASAAPHLLKGAFDQIRPDRKTVIGHLHGVPLSGNAYDAFPSGHAMHVGALASAASQLPPAQRNVVWSIGAVLVSTRIVLLAHWASDVLAGLALGVVLERGLRFLTGYGQTSRRDADAVPAINNAAAARWRAQAHRLRLPAAAR